MMKIKSENIIENDLQAIERIFIEYPKLYKIKKQELASADDERQDLLHALELGKLDAISRTKIANDLKAVSVRRRKIKNNLEVLKVVSHFSHTFSNNSHKDKQIETVTNTVKNITSRDRKYTMRVRTDLQKLVEVEQ